MLLFFCELPIFMLCSQPRKTWESAYLKSFEQGSWLWISATTNKRKRRMSNCSRERETTAARTSHITATERRDIRVWLTTGCLECLRTTWWHSTTPGKPASLLTCCFTDTVVIGRTYPCSDAHRAEPPVHSSGTIYSCNLLTKAFMIFCFLIPLFTSFLAFIHIYYSSNEWRKGMGKGSLKCYTEAR